MTKDEIRRQMRRARRERSAAWVRRNSARIQRVVTALPEFAAARRVFCYLARPDEVQTEPILRACFDGAKDVAVPAFCPETGAYRPARFERGSGLGVGPHGLPEPAEPVWVELGRQTVALVPGVAFDESGGRLGHGGGHYDRMLRGRAAARIALAFDFQVLESVPMDANDEPMDMIVTEKRLIPGARGAGRRKGNRLC
jgi:5-formyltetrahydrofolate cyclo-ligase